MSSEGTAEPDRPADPTSPVDGSDVPVVEQRSEIPASDSWRMTLPGRAGVATSVLVHVGVLLWVIGWLSPAQMPAEEEVIPVTLVKEEEAAKPLPPAPPEKAAQESAAPKSEPPASKPPDPKPPPPPAQGESRPTPPPQSEPAKPPPPSENKPVQPAPPESAGSDVLAALGMAEDSRPTTLSREELDAVKAQAKRCWKIPAGWSEPRQVTVTLRFQLNRDGTLKGSPAVVAFPASELGKTAALNAIRAVAECGPFNLPADKYEQWNDIQLSFEP